MNDSCLPDAPVITNTPNGRPGPKAKEIALAELAHLWKLDNPVWVAQRERDWQFLSENIYAEIPKGERKLKELYFKFGKMDAYISERAFFFLTPYETVEQVQQLFNSQLLDSGGRQFVLTGYIYLYPQNEPTHWYESHMRLVINSLLGDQYRIIKEQVSAKHTKIISPDPTFWSWMFVLKVIKAISAHKEWIPFYECINYFVSILPFAIKEDRENIQLTKLLTLVGEKLAAGQLNGRALTFAQELKTREQEILLAWDTGEQKLTAMKQES